MCGINGFNFSDEKLIQAMNDKIRHRGPDDRGYFVDSRISLGHNRLSIIDLSERGHQPMISSDKNYIITYNGELYNYLEIKKGLLKKGYKFQSDTDTEVILNAYIEAGPDCLQDFNGIFALAIWDKRKQELFIARDQFGVKPLVYYFKDNKFIFSSEIKGLLTHDINKDLDFDSLNLYFRFLYVPGPRTIFKHIKKLSPGHYLLLKNNNLKITRYYQVPQTKSGLSFIEAKTQVRHIFDRAVKRQLVSDRPLGIFLSGGIDSTAILGSMSQVVKHQIKTFTVKFDVDVEEEKFNTDSYLAKKNSDYYHTDHHELLVKPSDVRDNLEKVIYHMDDLVANHTQTATYLLAQLAKQEVAVVLGGDGGDEIFAGYDRYYYYNLIDRLQKIPKFLRQNFLSKILADSFHKNAWYNKLNAYDNLDLFWQFRSQKEKSITRFLKADINNLSNVRQIIKEEHFLKSTGNLTEQLMKVDFDSWLVDESLTKTDKLTMAHGLEERVPFLDRELVELAASLPMKYKLASREQGKYIFKEAVKDYLPDYIYDKPKTGWFSPAAKWLRTGLKDFAYEVLSDGYNTDTSDYFDFVEIKKILDNHISRKNYALNTIWPIMTFQIWYKLFKSNGK